MKPPEPEPNNYILRALPSETLERLWPDLDPVELAQGQLLHDSDDPVQQLYFIDRGMVSLVKSMADGRRMEVGAVGIEGLTDPHALFGIDRAFVEAMVQLGGNAFRIDRDDLMRASNRDEALLETLRNYTRFSISNLVQTSACNRLHSLTQRCCRWLLICRDNAMGDEFALTHEFLAIMLGVERPSVSTTLAKLRTAGLIDYERAGLTISNAEKLEERACECYRIHRAALKALFPERNA